MGTKTIEILEILIIRLSFHSCPYLTTLSCLVVVGSHGCRPVDTAPYWPLDIKTGHQQTYDHVPSLRQLYVNPVHSKREAAARHELTLGRKAATIKQRHPAMPLYCSVITAVTTEERKRTRAGGMSPSTSDESSSDKLPKSLETFRRFRRFPPKFERRHRVRSGVW